jgi:hypothetical protein
LDEIRKILETYIRFILENEADQDSLYEIVKNTIFTYYHNKPETYSKILHPLSLAIEDRRFTNGIEEMFPANSLFFTGVIKVSRNLK